MPERGLNEQVAASPPRTSEDLAALSLHSPLVAAGRRPSCQRPKPNGRCRSEAMAAVSVRASEPTHVLSCAGSVVVADTPPPPSRRACSGRS